VIATLAAWALSPAGKVIGGLALAGAVIGGAYAIGRHDGRAAGRADQMADTLAAYEKRKGIDNDIAKLDRVALCVELGGLRDQCEQLRGLETR
jgi:hypothetical protein